MLLVAAVAFAWVLFGSLPSRSTQESAVARFSVSGMQPGDHRLVEWNNKPLYIVYRKESWEAALLSADPVAYRDAGSRHSVQPTNATNALRSPVQSWFVTLGLGTGMGCSLVMDPPDSTAADVLAAAGGFTDGCDKSRYDLAGRVYSRQEARRNTVVPEWRLVGEEILVGE